jgi:hypothetical protein
MSTAKPQPFDPAKRREMLLRVATELLAARLTNPTLRWPSKGDSRRDAVTYAVDTADELMGAVWERVSR